MEYLGNYPYVPGPVCQVRRQDKGTVNTSSTQGFEPIGYLKSFGDL